MTSSMTASSNFYTPSSNHIHYIYIAHSVQKSCIRRAYYINLSSVNDEEVKLKALIFNGL